MSFYRKIKYFLVHTLMLSNKSSQELIDNGLVEIDGIVILENFFITEYSEIKVNGKIERPKTELVYLKFHKPAGFESTLNISIPDNLFEFFKTFKNVAIAGRLDKQSEGLMLLSNDGKWVEKMCNPKFEKEKEYLVTLNQKPDELFFERFCSGVQIGNHITSPCICESLEGTNIRIILKEGKNRQIRRMCKKLGYEVKRLIRVRIDAYELGDLMKGEVQKSFSNSDKIDKVTIL